jgi:hypothetical protein
MNVKWVIGLVAIFVLGSMLSGIMENVYLGAGGEQEGVIERLFSMPSFSGQGIFGVTETILVATVNWVGAFWDLLWWNYAFFTGFYAIIRYAVCFPISIGMIYGMFTVMRGSGG